MTEIVKWLTTMPSPWDCLASLAAAGALWVSYLNRKDKKLDLEPIFEPQATFNGSKTVYFQVQIRNRFPYVLQISSVRVLSEKGVRVSARHEVNKAGAVHGFVPPNETVANLKIKLKPVGEDAPWAGYVRVGYGDSTRLEFVAEFPTEKIPTSAVLGFEIRSATAGSKAKMARIPVDIERKG